ncbi:hypothetical protein T08_8017, partial [Trichinella sp. T8]
LNRHFLELKALGKDVNCGLSGFHVILPTLITKPPSGTVTEWKIFVMDKKDDEIHLDVFIAFLLEQARIKDTDIRSRTKAPTKGHQQEPHHNTRKPDLRFTTAAVQMEPGGGCPVCNGDHMADRFPRTSQVGFGLSCSPFLAMRVIRHHAQSHGKVTALADKDRSDILYWNRWLDVLTFVHPADNPSWTARYQLRSTVSWISWKDELERLSATQVQRALVPVPGDQVSRSELHGFGEAAEAAYGAVAYQLKQARDGVPQVRFVLANAHACITKEMGFQTYKQIYWSCSSVALTDNPADRLSRDCTLERLLKDHLWWNGPDWLQQPESEWPRLSVVVSPEEARGTDPEWRTTVALTTTLPVVVLLDSVLTPIVGIMFQIQYFVCCCAKSISLPERDQPPPFSLDLP